MRSIMIIKYIFVSFVFLLSLTPSLIDGYELPSVNLGFTSFLDGSPPTGPGFYLMQYAQYYGADKFCDKDGHHLKLPSPSGLVRPELDAWISLTEFIYLSNQKGLFGAKWGLVLIIPLVSLDLDRKNNFVIRDESSGVGDLLIAPILQWDPVMRGSRPVFVHRLVPQLLLPTGRYDDEKEINPGSNFFSFNPYWAATFFMTPRLTASWRIHYLWNDENNDPNKHLYRGAEDVRAGQAFHANFSAGYSLLPHRLHIGFNGYYLKQITDTEIDGRNTSGTKEQVFAIGPGVLYSFSQHTHIFFNIYFETQAENRTQGDRINIRLVHHF